MNFLEWRDQNNWFSSQDYWYDQYKNFGSEIEKGKNVKIVARVQGPPFYDNYDTFHGGSYFYFFENASDAVLFKLTFG